MRALCLCIRRLRWWFKMSMHVGRQDVAPLPPRILAAGTRRTSSRVLTLSFYATPAIIEAFDFATGIHMDDFMDFSRTTTVMCSRKLTQGNLERIGHLRIYQICNRWDRYGASQSTQTLERPSKMLHKLMVYDCHRSVVNWSVVFAEMIPLSRTMRCQYCHS